ncbi:hypothetical protein [Bacteroides sp. 224]|nr:hypothetical protein [Bacteroides sp. 224]
MSIAAQTLSVIEGIWDRGELKDIKLFAIRNGEQEGSVPYWITH